MATKNYGYMTENMDMIDKDIKEREDEIRIHASNAEIHTTQAEHDKLAGIEDYANNYVHPSYSPQDSGLYKVTVDGKGHVSETNAVVKSDITGLGIPAQDTVYTASTGIKLDGTVIKHENPKPSDDDITAKGSEGDLTYGGTFSVPSITYDKQGHITKSGTTTMKLPAETVYTADDGIKLVDKKIVHSNSKVTPVLAQSDKTITPDYGDEFSFSSVAYDEWGHITGKDITKVQMPAEQTSVTGSSGSCTGNAATATALETARTLTVGATGKTFDGINNVQWSFDDIQDDAHQFVAKTDKNLWNETAETVKNRLINSLEVITDFVFGTNPTSGGIYVSNKTYLPFGANFVISEPASIIGGNTVAVEVARSGHFVGINSTNPAVAGKVVRVRGRVRIVE